MYACTFTWIYHIPIWPLWDSMGVNSPQAHRWAEFGTHRRPQRAGHAHLVLDWKFWKGTKIFEHKLYKDMLVQMYHDIYRLLRRHAGSWLLFWLVRISSISGAECSFRYLNNLESLWFCLNWSRLRWSTKQRVCSKRAFWSSWSRHWPGTAGHVPTVCVLSPPVTLPASMKSSRPLGHQNKSSWRCSLMSFIDISTENELSKCFRMRTCFYESEGNVTFEWK